MAKGSSGGGTVQIVTGIVEPVIDTKLIVSASPHVRSEETTQSLMANVIVALCPCVVA